MSDQETEFADFELDQNFNDVKEFGGGGFDLVTPGEYPLDIIGVEPPKGSKASGTPMIVVTFRIPDDHAMHPGQQLWGNYSLSPKALGRLKQLMMACGANLDKFRASEIMGARILADVVHNEGDARVGADGNPLPTKTFANVVNERSITGEAPAAPEPAKAAPKAEPAKAAAKAATPPIANAKPTNSTGTTRRA
jgi:hypothetical protein